MQVTRFDERYQLSEWAEKLKSIAEKRSDQFAVSALQREIDELKSGRFMLVVLGKVKRGKSTLCNAFLGRHDDLIAPVDKLPASSVISKFIHDEKEWVRILYRDGRTEKTDYRHVRDFVTEQSNPGNQKDVECVEVFGPFPGLEKDLVLVDTPGAGSIHKHHDAILHGFLPQADAVIFLVTARMPIAEDELELLRELKSQDIKKVFFAINQVDASDEDEIRDGVEHNAKMLSNAGIQVDTIYRISAKRAMQGDVAGSGLPVLLSDISDFLAKNKAQVLRSNFMAKTTALASSLADAISLEVDSASKSKEQLEAELDALQKSQSAVNQGRELAEQRFLHAWKSAIEDFDASLDDAQNQAATKVIKKIQETSMLGVKALTKDLPTIISRAVEDGLADGSVRCERELREATEKLGQEFPSINIGSNREITLRVGDQSKALVKGAAGAGLLAGAGAVTIGAASTVTASVVAANALAAATATQAAATLAAASAAAAGTATTGGLMAAGGALLTGISGFLTGGWSLLAGLVGAGATAAGTAAVTAGAGAAGIASTPIVISTLAIPTWVVFAGPIGWTLAGLSVLVIPISYRSARLKAKHEFEEASEQEIRKLFATIRKDRVPQIKKMSGRIVEEYRLKLKNDLEQIENAISSAMRRKGSTKDLPQLQRLSEDLLALVKQSESFASS